MTQAVVQVRNIVARSGFANPLTLEVLVTDEDYLKVYADTALLDNGPDYEITGIGDPNGVSIEIIGAEDVDNYVGTISFVAVYEPPLDQQTDLSAGGVLGRNYESGLDQQNRRLQAVGDRVLRSIKMPVTVDGDMVLDEPVDQWGLVWDDDTQRLIWAVVNDVGAQAATLPSGGTTGQLLAKNSNTDFDTGWIDGAFTAAAISFAPAGGLSATEVQSALEELDTEKLTATPVDARNALDTAPYVATRTALKALDTTKDTVAILTEAGRAGVFVFLAGDYSTHVNADAQEGVYVKATAILSSAGAWVREYQGPLQADWFGMAASASAAANKTALNAALAVSIFLTGGVVELPAGTLACDNGITHTGLEPLILRGQGMGVTILSATAGANFLTINPSPFSAVDIVLEDLTIQQASSGVTNTGMVIARCNFRANRLAVRGFSVGMYLDETYSFDIVECAFNNQATHGVQANANTANNAAIVRTFFGGIGVSIFGPAIRIESAENVLIQGCQFEQNGRNLRMDDCNTVAFVDNYSEYEADVPINFVGTNYNVVIQRNTFALYTNSWALENVVELTMTDNWLYNCTTTIATTCLRPVVERNQKTGTGTFPSVNITPRKMIATIVGSNKALTNNITTAQNLFDSANDALEVEAGALYRFRARVALNTGATSHTTAFGLGGTATFTECRYTSLALSSADLTLGTPQMRRVTSNAAAVLTAASTEVRTDIMLEGTMRINAAGTIIPQVTFSAGPTGTCETTIGSFFELEYVAPAAAAAVGPWA